MNVKNKYDKLKIGLCPAGALKLRQLLLDNETII